MPFKQIDPDRARELLEAGEGFRYLDVRLEEEFVAGHVPAALNVPLLRRGPHGAGLEPNPNFVAEVEAQLAKETPIIVGCLRGGRSRQAADLLARNGFTNVYDMRGGYQGETDPIGKVIFPGWALRGFPTAAGADSQT